MEMKNILNRMLNHEELTREETKNIILGITQSEFPEEQITALLTGLQMNFSVSVMVFWRLVFLPFSIATDTSMLLVPVVIARIPSISLLLLVSSLLVQDIRWLNMVTSLQLR